MSASIPWWLDLLFKPLADLDIAGGLVKDGLDGGALRADDQELFIQEVEGGANPWEGKARRRGGGTA